MKEKKQNHKSTINKKLNTDSLEIKIILGVILKDENTK